MRWYSVVGTEVLAAAASSSSKEVTVCCRVRSDSDSAVARSAYPIYIFCWRLIHEAPPGKMGM